MTKIEIDEELLTNIIRGDYNTWIPIKSFDYRFSDDLRQMFEDLDAHHQEETSYLIALCRELAKKACCDCGMEYAKFCNSCDVDVSQD